MKSVKVYPCGIPVLVSGFLALLGLFELGSVAHFGYRLGYEEGVAFRREELLVVVASFGGVFCGVFGLILCETRSAGAFMKAVARVSICLSLAGVAILVASPGSMGVHSIQSAFNECLNNSRKMDFAKDEWAYRTGVTNGSAVTWDDIAPAFTNGFPVCPEGGRYSLGKIGEPVQCSIPGHRSAN
jgi:hypothetical protein